VCRAKTEDHLLHITRRSEQVKILYSRSTHWGGRDIENRNGICIIGYSISIYSNGKSEEERPLGEARCMWEDDINVVLKIIELDGEHGLG
jgi:hypothetical protein